MQYETIILELLSRIKKLEEDVALLKQAQQNRIVVEDTSKSESSIGYTKMTDEMIEICYQYGKQVYHGKNPQDLAADINRETGMNRNSAFMYVCAVNSLLSGDVFKRAISNRALQKYLNKIHDEYGKEGLKKALQATKLNIEYRKSCNLPVDSIEELCGKFERQL